MSACKNVIIRASAVVLLALVSHVACAQEQDKTPTGPTSATDGGVKVHGGRFSRRNHALAKKLGGEISSTEHEWKSSRNQRAASYVKPTEHPGKSFRKQNRKSRMGGESRVFKRHNHFASHTSRNKGSKRH